MILAIKSILAGGLLLILGSLLGSVAAFAGYLFLSPGLPSATSLKQVQLQIPLRVYDTRGQLLAEYGEKRRKPLNLNEIPELLQKAFLAAEDDRFFKHPGVDYQGILRAAWNLLRTGEKGQGGSTITMQLARNFYLSRERTYTRKLREIFLALTIERELSKSEILTLYLNKIYLGNRAYGVGAAADTYYGRNVGCLSLAHMAMIAGLPKAPSRFNPVVNPERALLRRNYVLERMREVGYIDDQVYAGASGQPITARLHSPSITVKAAYVGEMVRLHMVNRYGVQAYTSGFNVYTTVHPPLQQAANHAIRANLLAYDKRHGYRGPEAEVAQEILSDPQLWDAVLQQHPIVNQLIPALVKEANPEGAVVYLGNGDQVSLDLEAVKWAKKYVNENIQGPEPERVDQVLTAGQVIRVERLPDDKWTLSQIPEVAGALVVLRPQDGAILALSGGFEFFTSKFNRAVQAQRQPGSSFKPFIYSAALEQGYTPASIINDAPVVFDDAALEDTWRPENYSGKFFGPTRLRVALSKSRNLVSIRLLNAIGMSEALRHIEAFGFARDGLPQDLSLALGSGSVTPLELAAGYAVFANGGYRITPYYIDRIETADGAVLYDRLAECQPPCTQERATPEEIAVEEATNQQNTTEGPEIEPDIAATNVYQIVTMMQDVIKHGTGRRALVLGREDLAGKTGTTNDQRDAWFSGFAGDLVVTVWVGFDELKPLGNAEAGSAAALPMWIEFMQAALQDRPLHFMPQPEGMVTVRIDPLTGLLAGADNEQGIFETFREEYAPTETTAFEQPPPGDQQDGADVEIPEQLF